MTTIATLPMNTSLAIKRVDGEAVGTVEIFTLGRLSAVDANVPCAPARVRVSSLTTESAPLHTMLRLGVPAEIGYVTRFLVTFRSGPRRGVVADINKN